MAKLKDSVGIESKCCLCAALQRGMKVKLSCSLEERKAIQTGKRKKCKHVQLDKEKSDK